MAEYIDRQAVNDALDKTCDIVCQYSKKQRYAMCGACPLGSAYDAIENVPSVHPTLYGYNIEHLELIARVLQKEDLPPDRVTEALTDIGRIVAIVTDEFKETLQRAVQNIEWRTNE